MVISQPFHKPHGSRALTHDSATEEQPQLVCPSVHGDDNEL